ncbi:mobile mystery protein A [Synechococcus sp. BA-132 BA5]|uniref:mobile mystery protein A n=1 Tax=Synechococcus sp. BA-132 BA5 TaxID=3110252 RepID=UPI002B1FA2FC|nr:mobile mystery protein A [Synechococcus sp. BA-132 BA5]MEA5414865.1 mobile mystery protein A [Synechococcus sp. BA-132 BA5]
MKAKELRLAQMDAVLQEAHSHPLPPRPAAGWLRAIREALGMTSAVLAARLQITSSGLRKLEQAEAGDAITLSTLRRVAAALNCDLHYALVPRQPLREMRKQRALSLAQQWQQRAGRTMALEAQPIEFPSAAANDRLEAMAQEILRTSGTRLWD